MTGNPVSNSRSFTARAIAAGVDPEKAKRIRKTRNATEEEIFTAMKAGTHKSLPRGNDHLTRKKSQETKAAEAGFKEYQVQHLMRVRGLTWEAGLERLIITRDLGVDPAEVEIIARYMDMTYRQAAEHIHKQNSGSARD